jgi:hypothetical protein
MLFSVALASCYLIAQAAAAAPPARPAIRLAPQVTSCPSPAEVEAALGRSLGSRKLSSDQWVLAYGRDRVAAAVDRDASLWLVFSNPSGQRRIERRIPASSEECSAIADAMAAVVELSLRELDLPPPVAPPPKSASKPEPSGQGAKPSSRLPRLVVGAGPLLGTSGRVGANLLLEARVRVAGPFCLRLGGALLSASVSQRVDTGTVRVTSRAFTLAPLVVLPSTWVEWALGPVLLLSYDQGSGDLLQDGSGDRATLAVGGAVVAAVHLSAHWRLGLGLEGFYTASGADFFVVLDSKPTVVLAPPSWQGIVALRLEFLAWR